MAKLYVDRLIKKYGIKPGKKGWTGAQYRELMDKIISHNSEQMSKAVYRLNDDVFKKENKKIRKKPKGKDKALVLPDVTDVLPKRSVFIKKGAEKGELINQTLRDRLTGNLRDILAKPEYIRKRGKLAGTLKKQALTDFQRQITDTFKSYTRKDPTIGVPTNIKAIVTTEVRGTVNPIKHKYVESFRDKNPDTVVRKIWIHSGNVWGSKTYKPRQHHKRLHGVTKYVNQNYILKGPTGIYRVPYPHHESLPPEEIISCSCELKYIVRRRAKR